MTQSNCGAGRRERCGLTLMELVVVMAVLTALAAILVPMFPNLLRRAHKATDATQTSEASKALQLYQAAFVSYPDGYDLLTDGSAFADFLPGGGTNPFGSFVTNDVLTQDEVDALGRVGISNVNELAGTAGDAPVATGGAQGFHPTMNPYLNPGSTPISTALHFAVLDNAYAAARNMTLKTAIEADPGTTSGTTTTPPKFIVLGIGPRCSMIGQTIQDAPTSVPQDKGFTPATTYSRVGVVFKVSGAEVARTERARFICCVALEDDELESTEKDTVGYYDVARGTEH